VFLFSFYFGENFHDVVRKEMEGASGTKLGLEIVLG
jgi:hypothetical protein